VLSDDASTQTIEDVRVTIRPTRDAGTPWDFGGGLPDPKVRVEAGGKVLATCPEVKDTLVTTCHVGASAEGKVRVIVVDVDSKDDDVIGEVVLGDDATGALTVQATTHGGAGPWQRFRALWIALAIGAVVAGALAMYRRRHA
jgi:hypothetical protein